MLRVTGMESRRCENFLEDLSELVSMFIWLPNLRHALRRVPFN
jgi:hypothetical protein